VNRSSSLSNPSSAKSPLPRQFSIGGNRCGQSTPVVNEEKLESSSGASLDVLKSQFTGLRWPARAVRWRRSPDNPIGTPKPVR
jgi:hypothetical protein